MIHLLIGFASVDHIADTGSRWSAEGAVPAPMQPPAIDPLNPLCLPPIPPRRPSDAIQYPVVPLRPPPRLPSIPNSTNSISEMRGCNLPCFMVSPLRNGDFIGRDDVLEVMDGKLLPSFTTATDLNPRLFALCGMGGIGKTDLALEFAYSRKAKFDAIFWLEAGGVSQLESDFGSIPTHLGLQTPEEAESLEMNMEVAKSWLANPISSETGGLCQWLLIFDNADSLDIITDYLPHKGNGAVLITSRNPFAKEPLFSNGSGIDLEPLSSEDGAALLRKHLPEPAGGHSTDEQGASVELAAHLGGLPLAIPQMAASIRRRSLSIREFVNMYANDDRYAEIHDIGTPLQQRRYSYTLATTYDLTFKELSSNAARLLQILAFLNPDRVQENIFVQSMMDGGPWTDSTFDKARYELLTSSIVKRNIDKKELWIHRLMQAEVRTRMSDIERYQTFNEAISMLSRVWPPGSHSSQKVQRWRLCEDLLPHLERFHRLFIDFKTSWRNFTIDPVFPSLLNEASV